MLVQKFAAKKQSVWPNITNFTKVNGHCMHGTGFPVIHPGIKLLYSSTKQYMKINYNFLQQTNLIRVQSHSESLIIKLPLLEYLWEKRTCTTTISRTSGRERKSQEGQCQKSEKSTTIKGCKSISFNIGFFTPISVKSLEFCRYTHYDENGHRVDERVSNERYTSQFDSDPVDSAFGNLSSSPLLSFESLIIYSFF